MKKRFMSVLLLLIFLASVFSSHTAYAKNDNEKTSQSGIRTYADYIDARKRIAVEAGDVYGDVARDLFKAKEATEYASVADMLESVRMGRTDAALLSHGYVKQLEDSGMYPDFEFLWVPSDVYVNEAGPIFHTEELCDKYNKWFNTIKDDGTWQEIVDRWIGVPLPAQEDIPTFELTGDNGTLKMCDTGNYPPLIYFDANGEPTGFDVEMMSRFAQYMGMKLEITMMAYEAIAPYVVSGKADMSACTLTITDERMEGVIMGLPSVITQAVLIVPKSAESLTDIASAEPINEDSLSISAPKEGITTAADGRSGFRYTGYFDKKFAVMVGSVFDEIADRVFNASEKLYFNNVIDEIQAVHLGKADAALLDHVVAMVNLSGGEYVDLTTTEVPLDELNFKYAVFSDKQEIIDKYNQFLKTVKENGIYDEMEKRWFSDYDNARTVPSIPLTGKNGVLRIAINAAYPPFVYLGESGKWSGFDIEQFYRFAEYLDMDIEFSDMEFGALLPYVISGKCDIASSIYYTDERAKSVIFGDVDYIGKTVLVHKKDITVEKASGTSFINWIKTGIERNLITDNRWKMIVNGVGITMIISFAAQVFGTLFGCFVCFILMRKNRFVRWIGNFYCGLIHGTPIVVLLMITYYIIFGNTSISGVVIAIAAFTMVMGAGISQNLKGAIDTVDPVEIEAARSIGFSAFKAFKTVTLPQAVRRVLPSYTNGFVELVKSTAIVGYIAIQDLTRAGDIIRSRTYDAYFPLLFVALIYLSVTTICVQLFKLIIKKINGGVSQ